MPFSVDQSSWSDTICLIVFMHSEHSFHDDDYADRQCATDSFVSVLRQLLPIKSENESVNCTNAQRSSKTENK